MKNKVVIQNAITAQICSGTAFMRLRRINMPRCARRKTTRMRAAPLANQAVIASFGRRVKNFSLATGGEL
jgi:hypothetical protein